MNFSHSGISKLAIKNPNRLKDAKLFIVKDFEGVRGWMFFTFVWKFFLLKKCVLPPKKNGDGEMGGGNQTDQFYSCKFVCSYEYTTLLSLS